VAQQLAKGKHALVQGLAEKNAALSKDISFLATHLEELTNRKDDVIKETERLHDNYQISKRRIELVGMNQVLGKAFAEQSLTLDKLAGVSKQAELREEQIANINMARIQYNDELHDLRNIPNYVADLTADLSTEETTRIQGELEDLAEKRQKLLRQVLTTQRTYLMVLNDLDAANGKFLDIIGIYTDFLSKYLLWVRSASFPKLGELLTIPGQLVSLFSPANWFEAVQILRFQLLHSLTFVLVLVLVAIIFWKRKRLMGVLERTGKEVGKPASDRFIFTVQALGLTLLIAAPWPIFLAMLGWQLDIPESTAFTQAVSKALKLVAPAFYFLQIFRVMSIPNGFMEAHLHWSPSNLQRLRFELRWFMWVFLPIFFIAAISIFTDFSKLGGELGRIGIMALLITIAVIFFRLLRPRKGIVGEFLAQHPTSFLTRWHYLWFALILALPLLMAGLTVSGYIYSSGMLFGRLYRTVGLISGLIILYFLAIRWVLLVLHRKKSSQASSDEEPEIENPTLDKESNQLISNLIVVTGVIGLWYTWLKLLPALGLLNSVTLWYHIEMVSGVAKNLPVTLGDAGLAIIIIFIVVGGLKHFSTFQEIVLRQFTSMRPSTRYAFITLSSYAILATGTAFVFGLLGGSWKEIQWIFAALGVGIGFGLQEIVANFICGLIILFERPVRIGDVVTVGDIEGTVSRIQIRATTITMFDKKELLVPNKEFITGRLVNWSLSDPMTRIMVYIEIAYGSDIQKTMSIMSNAAKENAWVLKNPAPFVTIEGFVDNKLKLNLRCYIGLIEHRLQTITALHEEIIRKFNEVGIVIPAPQRDLNLNTGQALDIPLKHEDKKLES
jgi:potassium efflux system protein